MDSDKVIVSHLRKSVPICGLLLTFAASFAATPPKGVLFIDVMFTQPFAIPALALFILSIPLAIGFVPRNRVYGFRTKRTLGDDATWLRVNRYAGIAIMIASVIYFTITFSKPYDGDFRIWLVHLAAFAIPLAAALTMAAAYAKRS